jgi:hypothetical protein
VAVRLVPVNEEDIPACECKSLEDQDANDGTDTEDDTAELASYDPSNIMWNIITSLYNYVNNGNNNNNS